MRDAPSKAQPESIDEYIAGFPKEVRNILEELRLAIKEAAPEAEETISYRMPAFKLNGPLVYFAAFKNHIGFYPTASGMSAFQKELSAYKQGKGSVQFPLIEPIPFDIVRKIVRFKVEENKARSKSKERR